MRIALVAWTLSGGSALLVPAVALRGRPPAPVIMAEADDGGVPMPESEYGEDGDLRGRKALLSIISAVSQLGADEQRRIKLEVGTNWPPRTSTAKPFSDDREGYMFFQGPTPLTARQPDLASFWDDLKGVTSGAFSTKAKIVGGVFGTTFLLLLLSLLFG